MDTAQWIEQSVRAALSEALALIFPVVCAGCDEADIALCEACRAALEPSVECRAAEHPAAAAGGDEHGTPAIWSGLVFEDVAARAIRALKEDGRTSLARSLAPAFRAAFDAAIAAAGLSAAQPVVAVPLPTSRPAYRRRGYRVPDLLCRRADIAYARLLRPARSTLDQRGLDRAARTRNVSGSLVSAHVEGLRVIVVDDVVTTGATMREAVRALRAGGAQVLGAVTLASTPRHGRIGEAFQTHR